MVLYDGRLDLNGAGEGDAPLSVTRASFALLASLPVPNLPPPSAPSPQAAAGAPEYAGAEGTRGVFRAGGEGGEATAPPWEIIYMLWATNVDFPI